jgi:hypothetical protein
MSKALDLGVLNAICVLLNEIPGQCITLEFLRHARSPYTGVCNVGEHRGNFSSLQRIYWS